MKTKLQKRVAVIIVAIPVAFGIIDKNLQQGKI